MSDPLATIDEALQTALDHHQAGRLSQAEQAYQQILHVVPTHEYALHLLGVVALQSGRHEEAVTHIKAAIQLNGTVTEFYGNLSIALRALGRLDEAVAVCERAVEIRPDLVDVHRNLGFALSQIGRLPDAIAAFEQVVRMRPDQADSYRHLAIALMKDPARLGQAVAVLQRAIQLKPDYVEAYNDLGNVLTNLGRPADSLTAFQHALKLNPNHAGACNNLSIALRALGRIDEAAAACREAIRLQPGIAEAHTNLGVVLTDMGKLDEAVAAFQRALQLKPDYASAHSRLLFSLQYRAGMTAAELAQAHAAYHERHAAQFPAAKQLHANTRDPDRPLRIGFVSDGLGRHPAGYFLVRMLEALDSRQFTVICYADRAKTDQMTSRLRAASALWREVFQQGNQPLADVIRRDGVDVLIDLIGHAGGQRMLLFARKPAPVQVTWMGYVGTTGLAAMDYLIADRHEIPPEMERYYRERVLRMPDGYICYDPPDYAPAVTSLPALANGFVTFGSFNQPAKVNERVVKLWAALLHRVPGSRLLLKYKGYDNSGIADHYRRLFAAQGIDVHRIELRGKSPHAELLAEYTRVDICLDPFPYSGGLTTCEALWMGIPVITWPGETFAGRHSLSHMSNVGLTETIASDEDGYIQCAVRLAADLGHLAGIRQNLREKMAGSPLCDGARFARNWCDQIRGIWRRYCAEG